MRVLSRRFGSRRKLLFFALLVLLPPVLFFAGKRSSAGGAADSVSGPKIVVLNYHKVEDIHNSLAIRPAEFERQMAYLAERGFHTITPRELYEALAEGGTLPEHPVLITFDDGYADNYTNAYPILKKYGLKATIFVITDFLDRGLRGYLTWGQAAEMESSGLVSIESHTVTHGSMTEMTDEQLGYELSESKRDIEQRLGKEVLFVAYPTGAYNLHIASLVREAGYKGAFTIRYGNTDRASNLYAMERVPIFQTEDTHTSFLERLQYVPLFARLGWAKS